MKKIVFAIVACFGLLLLISSLVEGNNLYGENNDINAAIAIDNNYCFVGTFSFNDRFGGWKSFDVYELSNERGLYYAKYGNSYYKLISCDANGYNYYISFSGTKYFVQI